MPLVCDPGDGDAFALGDLIAALDAAGVDARDEEGFASLAPLLGRLSRNRTFLADLAIAELKSRFGGQDRSVYGSQVFLLQPANGRYILRANFWPARQDAVVRASGTAPFFYDLPHDHNFPFLTVGYVGPGYWSDYYESGADADALPGDPARLVFTGRRRLEPGQVFLYRAHRDVHVQLPPDAFSVTLNIIGYDLAQPWRGQYRFDVARDCVAECLTSTPAEALAALAVQFGGGNGRDVAETLMRRHPSVRMRRTALDALAGAAPDREARADRYAAATGDPALAWHARARLDRLQIGG